MWRRQEEPKVPPSPQNVVVAPPVAPISTPMTAQPIQTSVLHAAPPATHSISAPKSAVSVVCKGISIRGEVTGDEDLQIDGELSGSVKLAGARVMIGPDGRVTGNIQAREIIVRGNLKGNLRASERILMGSTGRWEGDGVSPRLAIEDGATVRGHLEVAEAADKKAQAPAPAKVEKPVAAAPSANGGNGSSAANGTNGGNGSSSASAPNVVRTENTANIGNGAKPVPVS